MELLYTSGVRTPVTKTWRHESLALLALWMAATALIIAASRLRPPPLHLSAVTRVPFVPAVPGQRPPTPRTTPIPTLADAVDAPAEEPAPDSDGVSGDLSGLSVSTDEEVDVMEEPDDERAYVHMGEYRWSYRSRSYHHGYNRAWRFRRGRILRPSASRFFSAGAVPGGASGDPCAVFPDACAAPPTSVGGSYDPPRAVTRVATTPSQATPATLSRAPGRWLLVNELLTAEIDVAALCRVTARRLGDEYPSVASFAAPAAAPCTVRETAAPWAERAGVAVELTWDDPAGSMRAVVALADDGAGLEASVARTDRSGATWLSNLGAEALTWSIAGVPVTVAPGGAVQVSASASGRSVAAARAAARSSSRS